MSEPNNQPLPKQSSHELVMAWAVDRDTGEPRYILQLDAAHRGAKSNCDCPSCGAPLQAVNNAKTEFRRRPHFRHPEGAAREHCVVIAARKALEQMLLQQDEILLPRRHRSGRVEGLSGQFYDVWVDRAPETVRISDCRFYDEAHAILTFDDGRRLHVTLIGRNVTRASGSHTEQIAHIELAVDDPALAMMSPDEIFARLRLAWSDACWRHHWNDQALDQEAETNARAAAVKALDWLDGDDDDLDGLTRDERRETLLHREVKAILEREKRIRLPGMEVKAERRRADGFLDRRVWSMPEVEAELSSVRLEVNLGHSRPDVLIEWKDDEDTRWTRTAIVEVTVTNPISDERLDRLTSFGWPVLEIDVGRMGGSVTREELTRLVVDEIAGKRWLFHPDLAGQEAVLMTEIERAAAKVEQEYKRMRALKAIPPEEWARCYLDALRSMWDEQQQANEPRVAGDFAPERNALAEAVEALKLHGYQDIPDTKLGRLRTTIARILSIKHGKGIEYKFKDAWGVINAIMCDRQPYSLRDHTLYLIALRVYQPPLSTEHQAKVANWRAEVMESIGNGETLYVRDTKNDGLLALLFPEMREALAHPFGTMMHIAEREKNEESRKGARQMRLGSSLDEDAALLEASGLASGAGKTPGVFASEYAFQLGSTSFTEPTLARLVSLGVAKNAWHWS